MGRAAALRADEYDWRSVAERYNTIYSDVIRRRRRHGQQAMAAAGCTPER